MDEPGTCRPLVTVGGHGLARVDVGAWAALALGVDGGPGSAYLCRPLAQRPAAFELAPGKTTTVRLRLALTVPDQDLSLVRVGVRATDAASDRPLPRAGEDVVRSAVASLVEPLRSLGGEASAAAVQVEVRCTVASL